MEYQFSRSLGRRLGASVSNTADRFRSSGRTHGFLRVEWVSYSGVSSDRLPSLERQRPLPNC